MAQAYQPPYVYLVLAVQPGPREMVMLTQMGHAGVAIFRFDGPNLVLVCDVRCQRSVGDEEIQVVHYSYLDLSGCAYCGPAY